MGATLRALRALALLAGFYLLGLLMLAVLIAVDWVATLTTHSAVFWKLYIVSALLAIPIVRGMFMLRIPRDQGEGLPVGETHEPRLWATVRELASVVGTRPPDEIRLTADMNASVSENARFLGLVSGVRRLYIGLPLMTGLSEAQLRAVLAHELGHYVNADTRLGGIVLRGRLQILRTVEHFEEQESKKVAKFRAKLEKRAAKAVAKGRKAKEIDTTGVGLTYRTMARIYRAYARFYFRTTEAGSRRQELAADLAAVRAAGRDATASALREIPVLDSAHDFYLESYATLGVDAGLLPPRGEILAGVRHLLAARDTELDELRRNLPDEPASPYDSHPPMAERVARIEALPPDHRPKEPTRPALELLHSPAVAMGAVEDLLLTPEARQLRRAEWPELVHLAMSTHYATQAEPLRGATAQLTGEASLRSLLDALDRGALAELISLLPAEDGAAGVRRGLLCLTAGEFIVSGRAHWEMSWSQPAQLQLPPGHRELLPPALDAAVTHPVDTAPLRKLLVP